MYTQHTCTHSHINNYVYLMCVMHDCCWCAAYSFWVYVARDSCVAYLYLYMRFSLPTMCPTSCVSNAFSWNLMTLILMNFGCRINYNVYVYIYVRIHMRTNRENYALVLCLGYTAELQLCAGNILKMIFILMMLPWLSIWWVFVSQFKHTLRHFLTAATYKNECAR